MPKIFQRSNDDKYALFNLGVERVERFCNVNKIQIPEIVCVVNPNWGFAACAYYRPQTITINIAKCANVAKEKTVRNWNWPGSTTDREPYGVLCHELGHHVDWLAGERKGSYFSEFSTNVMNESGEKPISGYAPNPAEWFAEMFRLFVTNPQLLEFLRPKTHYLLEQKFNPVGDYNWVTELGPDVPDRILRNLTKKVGEL